MSADGVIIEKVWLRRELAGWMLLHGIDSAVMAIYRSRAVEALELRSPTARGLDVCSRPTTRCPVGASTRLGTCRLLSRSVDFKDLETSEEE